MSETLTAANFSKAKLSDYSEFLYKDLQPGKKAGVFAYVKSAAIGGIFNADITLDVMPDGKIKILFGGINSVIEFIAEDVTHIDYGTTGGIKEWEVKTKSGISFEIVPR